ncbi:glycerol-3-phosphate dehydrogenase C-terminal domain-containing protein, partial [Deinococcus marmoris]
EQARTVEDVLSRRTRALLLNARASADAAPRVAVIMAEELGQDDGWQAAQVKAYRELATGYMLPGGVVSADAAGREKMEIRPV